MQLKLGADPELFVKGEDGFVSAYGMVPGDKANPHPVKGGAVQVDGMALEFNIDPAEDIEEFDNNITRVLSELRGMVPREYDMVAVPSVQFSDEVIANAPKEALRLGCEPDFNAYTECNNDSPDASSNMRTGAGHVHLGWGDFKVHSEEHWNSCVSLVKALDRTLGVWSVIQDRDNSRRSMYGKAGAFRVKPYGLEYRVMSNFWVFDKAHREEVWKITNKTFDWWKQDFDLEKYVLDNHNRILTDADYIINDSLYDRAVANWRFINHTMVNV